MKDCCTGGGGDYDLIVIGAGSAGFSAAIAAAGGGRRVALIGDGTIGGTCVNLGCVPSKALIRAAEAVHGGAAAARFPGVSPCTHAVDWAALMAGKDALVAALRRKKYVDLLPAWPLIDYVEDGLAGLVPGGVRVGGRVIRAPRRIIATGSHALIPQIPGIDRVPVLDSTALLSLAQRPDSLILIGGGTVGVELAQMMARLGSRVTLVTRSRLLPRAEPEAAAVLKDSLTAEGITVLDDLSYERVRRDGNEIALTLRRKGRERTLRASHLAATAGRRANTAGLGLEAAGIAVDAAGSIMVGEDMQTSLPGTYAAGDCTDRDRFVYMAAMGGRIAAENAVLGGRERYDNATMPWVVFTDPQVAGVGLTEAQARARGLAVQTATLDLSELPRAQAARDTRGIIKLVAEAGTGRLLGGTVVAPEGADSIQTLAMALKARMTARELSRTIFPYLTTVEGLKLAAQSFETDVSRLSCCAG